MREMKQTDVFYVDVKRKDEGKVVSKKTENGPSTDNGSVKPTKTVKTETIETKMTNTLDLFVEGEFRLFELYFYRIKFDYHYSSFSDGFLMERDFVCRNFFEIYMKELLTTRLAFETVTEREKEGGLISFEGFFGFPVF